MARRAGVLAALLAAAAASGLGPGDVAVVVGAATRAAAGPLLAHVLPEVRAAGLRVVAEDDVLNNASLTVVFALAAEPAPRRSAAAEAWEVRADGDARRLVVAGGRLGLAYALHSLREHVALGRDAAAWNARAPAAYEVRTWSEEGQLLDLPDVAYYSDDRSTINAALISAEMAALEGELVPAVLRLGFNSITILHSNIEDYVLYDALPQPVGGSSPPIWPAGDPHRARRDALVALVAPWIAHMQTSFGLAIFIQPYEFGAPAQLCAPVGTYNCSLGAPDLGAILDARYAEFQAAIAPDGYVMTVTDSWSPRASYVFKTLWTTTLELAQVATLFYHAAVTVAGSELVFRLWTLGQQVDWPTLRDNSPPGIEFSIKVTNGDFLLDFGLNPILNSTAPSERRFMVLTDAFRQYNGWTSGVAWVAPLWAPWLSIAHAHGVRDLNVWGSWAPGCTWPSQAPQLVNASGTGDKSWHGWWDTYRMFQPTVTNAGFSMTQANAFAMSALAFNVSARPEDIAVDFGTLFFGAANAAAVAALLAASLPMWLTTSFPQAIGDFTQMWTMMVRGDAFDTLVREGVSLDEVAASQAWFAGNATALVDAFGAVDAAAVPTPLAFAGLQAAVDKSVGYLDAFHAWRVAGFGNASLGAAPAPAACAAQAAAVGAAAASIASFAVTAPIESVQWNVREIAPELWSYPDFFSGSRYRSMAEWVGAWAAHLPGVCAGAP